MAFRAGPPRRGWHSARRSAWPGTEWMAFRVVRNTADGVPPARSGDRGRVSGDREGLPARPGRGRADPLPVRSRTPGGTHRPAHHRWLPAAIGPGTPAARQRQPGLPPPGRAAPAPARRARQVGVRQAGLALLDARRPRGPPALRPRNGPGIAGGCDAPHRAVPARGGRRRGAVDRDPARPGPHPPGGDAGPPGPDPPPHRERAVPGPRCLPGRRAAVRAAVHRPGRPHRGPPPVPRRDRQSRPPRAQRATPDHAAPPRRPPPPPRPPARTSSSPGWTRPGFWSGSGTA